MAASAVLGAAAGTGFALLIAVTIVVYRYYALRRSIKNWGHLDRNAESCAQASEKSPIRRGRPHPPVYTTVQVSASFIHSVPFHLL